MTFSPARAQPNQDTIMIHDDTMIAMHHNHPEAEEREQSKLWSNYTETQRAKVEEIAAWQSKAGLSDAQFVEGCPKMSYQSWYQLRTGRYSAKDCSRMVGIAVEHAANRRKTFVKAKTLSATPFPFCETDRFREIVDAVESAQAAAEAGDDDKIVWVIGRSGMGKTEAARQLVSRHGARLVTASESWREGYLDALTDFALAIDVPQPKSAKGDPKAWPSKGTAERAIMRHLANRPGILCVNEVEFFSRRVLNLLRAIADQTQTVVVIFCVPDFYTEILEQGGAYALQLRTRTEGVVFLDRVEVPDVEQSLRVFWPALSAETVRAAAKELRDYVNQFGGWRALKRIVRGLRGQFPTATHSPGLDDVVAAVALQKDYQHAR